VICRLAGLRIVAAMGADQVDADGTREAEIKGMRGIVLSPNLSSELLYCLLELESIRLNRDFDIAYGVALVRSRTASPVKKRSVPASRATSRNCRSAFC